MSAQPRRIAVLGNGGWGTALALLLHQQGHRVAVWGAFAEEIEQLAASRFNERYLPGVRVPEEVALTSDMNDALRDADIVVMAVPSHVVREVCERSVEHLPAAASVVSVAKGIESESLKRMSEVIEETAQPARLAVLSGPSHAEEVARGIPTAVVAASRDPAVARDIQECFMTDRFRVYTSNDVAGVELGGALKNVIAIAAGVCDGIGYGDNTKAALLTRGLAELSRLGSALGGRRETFAGLSGMGDLIVTCASRHSRNRAVGEQLGRGESLDSILGGMTMVAEGVRTSKGAWQLARQVGVEAPIAEKVHAVLYEGEDPRRAVHALMTRSPRSEFDPAGEP